MIQNQALAEKSFAHALTHLGEKEKTGNNDGPFVEMLQMWYAGKAELGAPWCALFCTHEIYVTAVLMNIHPRLPKSDSSTDLYAYAKSRGLLLTTPIQYCIGLIKGSGGTAGKTHHHCFRVESVDLKLGIVHSLDGNWGNSVMRTTHRIQDCSFVAVV